MNNNSAHLQVELMFENLEMFDDSGSANLKLEVGNMIDFRNVINSQNEKKIRPVSQFLLISEIKVNI